VTVNPEPSIRAGNSTIEQGKQLTAISNINHSPRPLPVARIAWGRSTKRRGF
jgi:hypothetical protein